VGIGFAGFHLGMDKDDNGFAFLANYEEQVVHFMGGVTIWCASIKLIIHEND